MRAPLLLLSLGILLTPSLAFADEPTRQGALDPLRERFREGMEKYNQGAYAEAIVIWEAIYRQLGIEKGYRLVFNIALAYDQFGDLTRAAENYEAYVGEVARRREANEKLEPLVDTQETEAQQRLQELAKTKGRLHVTSERSLAVSIDGGAEQLATRAGAMTYVSPGRHIVTFEPGTKSEHVTTIVADAGQVVEVAAPPAPEIVPPAAPPQRTETARFATVHEHPFHPGWLIGGAAMTVASIALPIVFYAKANDISSNYNQFKVENPPLARGLQPDYESARTTAYISLAVPIVLGAATAALTAYWYLKSKDERVRVGTLGSLTFF